MTMTMTMTMMRMRMRTMSSVSSQLMPIRCSTYFANANSFGITYVLYMVDGGLVDSTASFVGSKICTYFANGLGLPFGSTCSW